MRRKKIGRRPSIDPLPARAVIDPLFHWLKLDETARSFRALRAFHLAAGPRIAARARAEALRGATLYVRVASSAWSQELHALKAEIVDKLRKTPGGEGIEDLRFTVGPLDSAPAWNETPLPVSPDPDPHPPVSRAPAVADEIACAMGEVADGELRDELTRLYARLGCRTRPAR